MCHLCVCIYVCIYVHVIMYMCMYINMCIYSLAYVFVSYKRYQANTTLIDLVLIFPFSDFLG